MSAEVAAAAPKEPGWGSKTFAVLQRIGKSLMLPIATLPAAGLLVRFGQDDMLGRFNSTFLKNVAAVMSTGGNALLNNLPVIFAIGVAIGFAKKSDGTTAVAAIVGYLVYNAVSMQMFAGSKLKSQVLGLVIKNGDQGVNQAGAGRRAEVRPGHDQTEPHRGARRHPGRDHRRAAVAALLPDQAAHLAGVLRRAALRAHRHGRGVPVPGRG